MVAVGAAAQIAEASWGFGHMDGSAWVWMPLAMAGWIGLMAVMVRAVGRGSWAKPSNISTAEQILADRFARGDLGPEEYQERLDHLRTSR